jgi:hypothetical protein
VTQARAVLFAFALAFAFAFGSPGCSDEPASTDLAPRFVRSFIPVSSSWIPEAEIPAKPQKTPKMVIWELSAWQDDPSPTDEQVRAADEFARRCLEAAARKGWFEFQTGMQDGYELLFGDKRHYYNKEYIFDDRVLDPERPEFLMYYGTPRGQKLAGAMFYTRKPQERGRQFGGALTLWHYHIWSTRLCLLGGLLSVGKADADGHCARGVPMHRSPEMIHVWFFDHPQGRFASSMWLGPEQLGTLIERDEQREAGR